MTNSREPIVDTHAIGREWVEMRLAKSVGLPPGSVEAVRVRQHFDSCSARNTPIEVDYSPAVAGGFPSRLMLRHWREGLRVNEREIRFYAEIAPESAQTPTVPCYDVAWDRESGHWHVLLLDIGPTHVQAPKALSRPQRSLMMPGHAADRSRPRPYPKQAYVSLARAYASFHARWWNHSLINEERHCSSPGGPHCMAGVASVESIRSIAKRWHEHTLPSYRREHPEEPVPATWRICERAVEAWPDLLPRRIASGHLTLVQGDAHLGNVFFSRDPRSDHLYLLDWDAYQRGLGTSDLAHMLVLSHAPEVRRQVESHVLRTYHQFLLSYGVTDYSYDQCTADYRLSILASLFAPIAWKKPAFLNYALAAYDDWNCCELLG